MYFVLYSALLGTWGIGIQEVPLEGKDKIHQMKIYSSAIICSFFVVILSYARITIASDTLNVSRPLLHNETLTSRQGEFQLGLFNPGNSPKYYLGIWYNVDPTKIIWIANRENALNGSSGVISIGDDGNLVLLDNMEKKIWSTNLQNLSSGAIAAQLLDTGNLVLRDNNEGSVLWQSFDHPSHAMVAGMKLGWIMRTGLDLKLTSWKSSDDPSPGEYTYGIDLQGLPQLVIWNDTSIMYRSGPWNGVYFGGVPFVTDLPFTANVVVNSEEVYYEYKMVDNSSSLITAISPSGVLQFLLGNNSTNWREYFEIPGDRCGNYGYCGPNAICIEAQGRGCSCMTGYLPKFPEQWDIRDWSGGCAQKDPMNCSERNKFLEIEGVKMPSFLQFQVNLSMSMEECKAECLKNCSCSAYANAYASRDGCLLWFGDLVDVRKLLYYPDQRLYLRVTASDLGSSPKKKKKIILIVATIAGSILLLSAVLFLIWKKKARQEGGEHCREETENEDLELPSFDIVTIEESTQKFSARNKIGEGGFGPVYKGKLPTGQEVAVKRLSEKSSQGLDEFKNEVLLIAKLQHRNLVRLLGCCIHGEERMLIYEYMPNGSLDCYIFGDSNHTQRLLVWRRRYTIIVGIARGLLYLHRDSRLRIIHRDLKASNVLLDSEMNPKISDFGMARTFGEEQVTTKTKRVAGTYGYMAPEYAIDGIYSMKSDVFSFGVMVLEIVSGRRNSLFRHPDHNFNLLGHAWQLWLEGRPSDLIDPYMEDSFPMSEVMRCIQVGLLCVQQRPDDRPTMSSVLLMLDSETAVLPQPKRPGFFTERCFDETDSLLAGRWSPDMETRSTIQGR